MPKTNFSITFSIGKIILDNCKNYGTISGGHVSAFVGMTGSNTTRYTSSGIALRYIILSGTNCNATYCYPQPGTTPENVKTDADCARFFVDTFAADANYYCASYTDSKGNCRNVTNYTTNYSCSKGTLSCKECIILNRLVKNVLPNIHITMFVVNVRR